MDDKIISVCPWCSREYQTDRKTEGLSTPIPWDEFGSEYLLNLVFRRCISNLVQCTLPGTYDGMSDNDVRDVELGRIKSIIVGNQKYINILYQKIPGTYTVVSHIVIDKYDGIQRHRRIISSLIDNELPPYEE